MNIDEKLERIFSYGYVCDHCLGRQFAKLLSGFSNDQRGEALRRYYALSIDATGETEKIKMSNFLDFNFNNEKKLEFPRGEDEKCSVCCGFFSEIDKWVSLAIKSAGGKEFRSFSVGTILNDELLSREESMWEHAGVENCEPIKSEINREVGKRLEKKLEIKADLKNPEASFLIDIGKRKVMISINPIFIYGEYQKLVRGIPQTRWPSGKYRTSVEQIIAKPFMKITKGSGHKLHGLGREDIDARCLGWRPFVLEITSPVKRKIELASIAKEMKKTKKVLVRNLRISGMDEVREIKNSRASKEYRVLVLCNREIGNSDMRKIKSLATEIKQRTPERVKHRRADRIRKRNVISISARLLGKSKFMLFVKGEAGLYIKELVSGDNGRTKPSVSEILGCKCVPKDLDVIKIESRKKK